MDRYPNLFSPLRQGGLNIRNRIVMAALNNNFSTEEGMANDRILSFLEERARGGAGLIVSEATPVSWSGRHRIRCLAAYDDKFIPSLHRIAEVVHAQGAAFALQLHHAGRLSNEKVLGFSPVAPSPIPRGPGHPAPREINAEEIEQIVLDFGAAARRAKQAGLDAVEVHGAHGYLIQQFMSPSSNKRTDVYGGKSENRIRFALEVTREVRKQVGPSYPLLFRLSAREFIQDGYDLEEALDWAVELKKAGVSIFDVSGGTNNTWMSSLFVIPPMFFPAAFHAPSAAAIREAVKAPVIAVGRMDSLPLMEKILAEGKADLVASGRQFLTDPHWPIKAARGEEDRIRPCVYCNYCIWTLFQQKDITCFQNTAVGREKECRILNAKKAKNIFVIGGGPAGLEAARVAARRGHRVTLWEKDSRLGGQMILASIPHRKNTLSRSIEWLTREINQEGVEVRLNSKATLQTILDENPDAVILAAGAKPVIRAACTDTRVVTAWEVLRGAKIGSPSVILGGGMVGIETAEFLCEKGHKVTVVTSRSGMENLATDMEGTTRTLLLKRLPTMDIRFIFSAKVLEICGNQVHLTQDGQEQRLNADTLIIAQGVESDRELFPALKEGGPELIVIGDCVEPRSAKEAIHEGFHAALKI